MRFTPLVGLFAFTAALAATPALADENRPAHGWCFATTKKDPSGQGYVIDHPFPCPLEQSQGVPTQADTGDQRLRVDDSGFFALLRGYRLADWNPLGRVLGIVKGTDLQAE